MAERVAPGGSPAALCPLADPGGVATAADYLAQHRLHEALEILLESYLQEIMQTVDAIELSMDDVTATEKLVTFRLDAARNRLLKVEVAATAVGTVRRRPRPRDDRSRCSRPVVIVRRLAGVALAVERGPVDAAEGAVAQA